MVLVAPTLKIKMSIPSNALESAWPEPDLRDTKREGEHDDVLEFLHTQVFTRVVRECNMVLHPVNVKFVPENMAKGTRIRKQHFLNIRKLKRNFFGNGVVNIEFEIYMPLRLTRVLPEGNSLEEWFLRQYVQPLQSYCKDWSDENSNTHYDDWRKKVYGQLAETFRMMAEGTGLFVNLSVEKA